MGKPEIEKQQKKELAPGCTELIGQSKYDQKCMEVHQYHSNITQKRHGASRNYRYVLDVSTTREEKTFPASRFQRGELLPKGKIILIVITIVTSIIKIIITLIPSISTISI